MQDDGVRSNKVSVNEVWDLLKRYGIRAEYLHMSSLSVSARVEVAGSAPVEAYRPPEPVSYPLYLVNPGA